MRARFLYASSIVLVLAASGCLADSSPDSSSPEAEEGQRSDEVTASSGTAIWTKVFRPVSTREQVSTVAVATDGNGDTFVLRMKLTTATGWAYCDLSRYSATGTLELRKGLTDGRRVLKMAVGGGLVATIQAAENDSASPGNLVVYEAATGTERWRKERFVNWSLHPINVAVDASGRVVVLGMMDSPEEIDGTPVHDQNNYDHQGAVVAQFSSTGTLTWARRYASATNLDSMYTNGHDVAVDADGDVYVSGSFAYDIDFGGGTVLTNAEPWDGDGRIDGHLIDDGFVLKLSSAGTKRWVTHLQGIGEQRPLKIGVTGAGRVAIAGNFRQEVKYGNATVTATNPQAELWTKAFFSKLDTAGNHVWTKTMNGTSDSNINLARVMLDTGGRLVLAGTMRGTVTQGTTTYATGSPSLSDAFVGTFTATTGARAWLRTYGEQGSRVEATSAAITSSGRLVLGGEFVGSVDFGRGPITNGSVGTATTAGFLARLYE